MASPRTALRCAWAELVTFDLLFFTGLPYIPIVYAH